MVGDSRRHTEGRGAQRALYRRTGIASLLQFFAVFDEMLLLGAGDPVVVANAIREGVELRRHVFDVLVLPLGNLPKGEHAHAIQHSFHHRSDPVDLFQIVLLMRPCFSSTSPGGGRAVRSRSDRPCGFCWRPNTLSRAILDQPFSEGSDFLFTLADIHDPALFCFAEGNVFLFDFSTEHVEFFDSGS